MRSPCRRRNQLCPLLATEFDWRIYVPKSFTVIIQEGYRFADFRADAIAGLTVAIVAFRSPWRSRSLQARRPTRA